MTSPLTEQPAHKEIHIVVVKYRSAKIGPFERSTAEHIVKVPYGGLFGLNEVLARALAKRQLLWFTVKAPQKGQITPSMRGRLVRWQEALEADRERLQIDWSA